MKKRRGSERELVREQTADELDGTYRESGERLQCGAIDIRGIYI